MTDADGLRQGAHDERSYRSPTKGSRAKSSDAAVSTW